MNSIISTVEAFEKILEKKVKKTKPVYDLIRNVINDFVSIYKETENLKSIIQLDSFSSKEVQNILENSFKNLKSLRYIKEFTSILLLIDNTLQNYVKILEMFFKTYEEYQIKTNELENIKKKYLNYAESFAEAVKNLPQDSTDVIKENLDFKLSHLVVPFNSKCSKWIIVDKYNFFEDETLKKLHKNWTNIGRNVYLSENGNGELLEEALDIIPNTKFIEYFQCIGVSDNIMKERINDEFHIPKKQYEVMIQPHNRNEHQIISMSLNGDRQFQLLLGEYLLNEKCWNEAKYWLTKSQTKKGIKYIKSMEDKELI